jgi:ABC-type transport system involved in multi-copper enzyme maturation permease subunit
MRGLIIKDLLYIKNNYKMTFLMFIGSILISIALGNYLLAVTIVPITLLASAVSTFQTDEFYNTDAYTLSYPLSRKKIVLSKYLFTILMTILSTYIGIVIYLLIYVIINPGYNGLNLDMLKYLIMLECATLIVNSIFFPIIYKVGCEKSRYVLMSIIMLILGILAVGSVYINVINVTKIDWEAILAFINQNGILILSILVIVLMIISYILSVKFYKSRDY